MRRARTSFALLLVGCGALEQPERSGHSLADGLSPYRRADAVEVCQGSAELVRAASTNGEQGVCRPADRTPLGCSRHGDCRSREACVCGRCTVRLCEFSSDCPAHLSCAGSAPRRCTKRCTADRDCDGVEQCQDGLCSRRCNEVSECIDGELCLAGKCRVIACGSGGAACGASESCDLQRVEGRLRAPAALISGGRTVLYVELERSDGTAAILRAESTDGRHFKAVPDAPVLEPDAGRARIGAPAPLVESDRIVLFVELDGVEIGRAASTDGKSFGAVETALRATQGWEAGRVGAPSALRIGSRSLVFYEGGDGAGIGAYTSTGDNQPLVAISDLPLLTPRSFENAMHWTSLEGISAPWAIRVDSPLGDPQLRLFVAGRGREDTAPRSSEAGAPPINTSIGVAVAPLGNALALQVFAHNPVLADLKNLVPIGETQPSVVQAGNEWRMYYESDDGLYVATNPPR
jgi:hypothetical protein